ncbi:Sestrin-1, partial [Mortierella sp. AD031]
MLLSPIDDPKESPQSSSVTYSRFRAVLFQDLLDSNSQNRARALDNIVQIVTEWARVVTDNGSIADLSSHANPTPPFSPAPVACSIQATLFPNSNTLIDNSTNATTTTTTTTMSSVFHGQQHSIIGTALAMEKLTISTQQQRASSDDSDDSQQQQGYQSQRARQESTTMSSSSPMFSSPQTSNSACHSASSSTSAAEVQGTSLSQTVLSSSPMASSSYHFQNDPDVHFNRALPDKLSPLEERVAEVDEAARLLRHHILTILRFSVCCPYKDVKICLVGLLNELESLNIPIPKPIHPSASFFIEPKDIYLLDSPENSRCPSPTLSAKDRCSSSSSLSTLPATAAGCLPPSATKQIMTQTFANYGRTSNLFRIMAFFPSFWEKFESSQTCMMNGPGPIPKPWRCYVAIM